MFLLKLSVFAAQTTMLPSTFCTGLPAYTWSQTGCGFLEIPPVIVAIPKSQVPSSSSQNHRRESEDSESADSPPSWSESARHYGDDLTFWSASPIRPRRGEPREEGGFIRSKQRSSTFLLSWPDEGTPVSWAAPFLRTGRVFFVFFFRLETDGKWVVSYHYLNTASSERKKKMSHQPPEWNWLK